MTERKDWKWFGLAGHFIMGHACRFHLTTKVGGHLVSTIGQLWPERPVREIHAKVYDLAWFMKNRHLQGDEFDSAYMRRFGFETIGCNRKFETMVFKAGKPCSNKYCDCGQPDVNGSELDFSAYKTIAEATAGHLAMCEKYARKRS